MAPQIGIINTQCNLKPDAGIINGAFGAVFAILMFIYTVTFGDGASIFNPPAGVSMTGQVIAAIVAVLVGVVGLALTVIHIMKYKKAGDNDMDAGLYKKFAAAYLVLFILALVTFLWFLPIKVNSPLGFSMTVDVEAEWGIGMQVPLTAPVASSNQGAAIVRTHGFLERVLTLPRASCVVARRSPPSSTTCLQPSTASARPRLSPQENPQAVLVPPRRRRSARPQRPPPPPQACRYA